MKSSLLKIGLLYLLTLSFFITQAQDTSGKFTFSGKVTGQDTGYVRLSYINKEQKIVQDSVRLSKGNFSFTGYINEPIRASFGNTTSHRGDDPNYTDIFLEPVEMNVAVKVNDFKHTHVTGSKTQTEYEEVNKQKESIRKEMQPLDSAFTNNRTASLKDRNNTTLVAKDDSLRSLYKPFNERLRKIEYQFITTHPASFLSPYFLFGDLDYLPLDSAKMLYTALSPAIQNSYLGEKIGSRIQAKALNAVGKPVQDFSAKDINGKEVNIASFKGKNVVLIDFWASWCSPCRQGNPHLIELYKKYHDKGFDVISVSIDNDENAWKTAIAKDSIGIWHQVLNDSLAENFNITAIPVQLLIDKNGIIVGRYEGFNPNEEHGEIDKKLTELITQN